MPIKSYLAYPQKGKKDQLVEDIRLFENCEVIPSENEDVIIVVTETASQEDDDYLKEKIDALVNLELLTLVSGFNLPKN